MVRAGHVSVAIIHRTLTWTTWSLSCAHMLMHAVVRGGVRTPKESLHWMLTLGRKSLAAPGNRTCVSGVTVRCSDQLSYIPSDLVRSDALTNWATSLLILYGPMLWPTELHPFWSCTVRCSNQLSYIPSDLVCDKTKLSCRSTLDPEAYRMVCQLEMPANIIDHVTATPFWWIHSSLWPRSTIKQS